MACIRSPLPRADTNYDFIIYKAQDQHTLPPITSPEMTNSNCYSPASWPLGKSVRDTGFEVEAALAFGGSLRRTPRKVKKISGTRSESRRPSKDNMLCNAASSERRSSMTSLSSGSSMSTDAVEYERQQAWMAYRAKYEQRDDAAFGRYRAGRGYVEYCHRDKCDGSCGGACFGK